MSQSRTVLRRQRDRGWGGRRTRHSAYETPEIIRRVETSSLPVRTTLARTGQSGMRPPSERCRIARDHATAEECFRHNPATSALLRPRAPLPGQRQHP